MKACLLAAAVLCLGGVLSADEAPNAAVEALANDAKAPPALTAETPAPEVLRICRAMLPAHPVELKGSLILRSRKGIVAREYDYRLVMRRGVDVSLLAIHLMPRGETNEIAAVTVTRRPGVRPVIRLARAGAAEAEAASAFCSARAALFFEARDSWATSPESAGFTFAFSTIASTCFASMRVARYSYLEIAAFSTVRAASSQA